MIAFSACLHRSGLSDEDWERDLSIGTYVRFDSMPLVVRECFPSATISVLREGNRSQDVELALARKASQSEVAAVMTYLNQGVAAVKRPAQSMFDRADAAVATLGALPHVSHSYQETAQCGMHGKNWKGTASDEQIEGTFVCIR